MDSGANRSVDRSRSKSPALGNNSRLYLAIKTAISFRACVLFLVVTLINLFQVVVAAAAEGSNSGGLVDIGRGRKMYLDSDGRTIWIVDAHRDGKRFVVRADEKLTGFVELERAIYEFAVDLIS
jgi:hypothetical protein